MKNIPEKLTKLLEDETKAFAFLATVMPDFTPQVTPVWFTTDGEDILINSAKGRVKDINMRARPNVALAIPDPGNPYKYLQIRGLVVEIIEEGADEHFQVLAQIYTGKHFNTPNDQVRVIYRIRPDKVDAHG